MVAYAHAEPHLDYIFTKISKIKWAVQLRPIDFYHLQVATNLQKRDFPLPVDDLIRCFWNHL